MSHTMCGLVVKSNSTCMNVHKYEHDLLNFRCHKGYHRWVTINMSIVDNQSKIKINLALNNMLPPIIFRKDKYSHATTTNLYVYPNS